MARSKRLVKQALVWVQNKYTVLKEGDFEIPGLQLAAAGRRCLENG